MYYITIVRPLLVVCSVPQQSCTSKFFNFLFLNIPSTNILRANALDPINDCACSDNGFSMASYVFHDLYGALGNVIPMSVTNEPGD